MIRLSTVIALCVALVPVPVLAAQSGSFQTQAVTASLVVAQDGVATGTTTLSGGLYLKLGADWKTYWRSPGEVGIPPSVDWSGSENLASVDFLWPAPTRFHAFGIENFGYKNEVLFPLNFHLQQPGQPVRLRGRVSLLTCSLVCVPQDFELALDLPKGAGIDAGSAEQIARWSARIPDTGDQAGMVVETAALTQEGGEALVITLRSDQPLKSPDVFPEMTGKATFGPPDIRVGSGGHLLWARIPVNRQDAAAAGLDITITDDTRAATLPVVGLAAVAAPPPFALQAAAPTLLELLRISAIALIGGLILNVMPCVLPVLSIRLGAAMKVRGQDLARVRVGFLASAAGVMLFMWGLAGATLAARSLGLGVGWGVQFQSPVFLAAMTALLVLFAANLVGLYEIRLPARLSDALARASGQPALAGDLATGAFGAVLATPCSAPFLGTAVAFALAGRAGDIFIVFTAMGLGLALPYLLIAARPQLVRALPRPGRWMLGLKVVLGLMLALTAAWLLWVLNGVAGRNAAFAVVVVLVPAVALLALRLTQPSGWRRLRPVVVTGLVVVALAAPALTGTTDRVAALAPPSSREEIAWVQFAPSDIARRVSEGRVVFLDITADWCLTCKANKALVIERGDVARILADGTVTPMQGDWTRPDDRIARFLEANGRYGIPLNAVYGPKAPDGILLPEVLTQALVLDALRRAGWVDGVAVATAPAG